MRVTAFYIWPAVMTAAFTTFALTVRCVTLLIGLMSALRRVPRADRGRAFEEFARAICSRRPSTESRERTRVADSKAP
jgi:hypothetical protein